MLFGPCAGPGGAPGFGDSSSEHPLAHLSDVQQAAVGGGGHGGSRMLSALPASGDSGNGTSHAAALKVVKGGAGN